MLKLKFCGGSFLFSNLLRRTSNKDPWERGRLATTTATIYIGKTANMHVHHAFLYISFPSLLDYHGKLPNFTLMEGENT